MNEARLLRILRLPLITLLAINLAALLISPLYRTRQVSGPRSMEQAADTILGHASIAPTQDESPSDQDPSSSAATKPVVVNDHQERRTTAGAESAPSAHLVDEREAIEPSREWSTVGADYGLDWEPLIAVGKQLALPKSTVEPFGRPIAGVAGRLSKWLAVPADLDHLAKELAESQNSSNSPTASRFVAESSDLPRDRIVLRNPRENRLRVAFLLDEQVQTLEPGSELIVDSARANLRFDRGSDYGESRLVLEPGAYRFAVGSQGWRLQSEEVAPE